MAPRPRERILAAATRLFSEEGIHATGVDRVVTEAGVAPMTVYRHFAGKDELVTATLERWSEQWLGWLRSEARGDDARARLEGLWDALEKWFADEGFHGSYVANVANELRAKPGHPAQATIAAHRPWIMCEVLYGRRTDELEEVMAPHGYTWYHLRGEEAAPHHRQREAPDPQRAGAAQAPRHVRDRAGR